MDGIRINKAKVVLAGYDESIEERANCFGFIGAGRVLVGLEVVGQGTLQLCGNAALDKGESDRLALGIPC